MCDPSTGILRIPRDASFPTLNRSESFDVYAHAYWLAAEKLFDNFWGEDGTPLPPDYMLLPVLFSLHHYVELELKEIVRMSYLVGNSTGRTVSPLPKKGGHSLTCLLNIAMKNLALVCPGESPLVDGSRKDLVEDMESFGKKGEAWRYPNEIPDKGGDPTLPDSFVADVKAVFQEFRMIKKRFDGYIGWLHDAYQHIEDLEIQARYD